MTEKLKPCPFCGATPHRGLSKVKHDQLHGYSYQDTTIKCPHLCASMEGGLETVVERWNTRATVTPQEAAEHACAVIDAHSEYDQNACCDGRECSCGGETVHDHMKLMIRRAISEDSHE